MQRFNIQPRNNWQKAVEELGFGFHTADVPYWDESAYYTLSLDEINYIEKVTAELWQMCLEAVQYVIDKKLYEVFHIPLAFAPFIERSWDNDAPSIYGRFDFGYNTQGDIKLFEFNADTPTSLFEAGIVQWYWLQDFKKEADQFNSIHEKLVDYWGELKPFMKDPGLLHFSCVKYSLEDLTTTEYLRDCAIQGGIDTKLIYIDEIGWDTHRQAFVDLEGIDIKNIFKLYPYESLIREDFGRNLLLDINTAQWIEPPWKMILSNKALLPILWRLFPNCPYILECYFEKDNTMSSFVKKPIFSREGANVSIIKDGQVTAETTGDYGEEGFICQAYFELPDFEGKHPILGSWVIGQQPAGMGIREDTTLITGNKSSFVPHLIEG